MKKVVERFLSSRYFLDFIFLALSQYSGMLFSIFFSIYLTRLLNPEDYGVFATILFSYNFFNWITEWGWENGLMTSSVQDLLDHFSTNLIFRAIFSLFPIFFISLPVFFLKKETFYLVIIFGLSYWLEKVFFVYKTVLEKKQQLKFLAFVEFFSNTFSLIFALALALSGFGVYSLVAQRFFEKFIFAFCCTFFSKFDFKLRFDFAFLKKSFKTFGFSTWISNLVGIVIYDFMPFLISMFSGQASSGLYVKAYSLGTFPLMLTSVFSRITSPIYANNFENKKVLSRSFFLAQKIKGFILIPGQIFLILTSKFWIPFFLGKAWIGLVSVYKPIAFYGLFRSFYDDLGPLFLFGFKKPWVLTKNQIIHSFFILTFSVPLVFYFQSWGAAFAMSFSMLIVTVLFWRDAFNFLKF